MSEYEEPHSNSLISSVVRKLSGWRREPKDVVQRTGEEIQDWLISRLAEALGMPADEVDVRVPFADHGLDSRTAVKLSGDLEQWLGLELPPTLVWDYPMINRMVSFLEAESAAKFASPDAES